MRSPLRPTRLAALLLGLGCLAQAHAEALPAVVDKVLLQQPSVRSAQALLRAGLPADWRVGEKTGTFQTDANDSGVVWPPNRAPLIVSAYLADSPVDSAARDATLAEVGRIVREIVG